MTEIEQQSLNGFVDPTATHMEPVTRTVKCRLETSQRKTTRIREKIDAWQEIAARMAELMPSYRESQWRPRIQNRFKVVQREFPTEGHGINGLKSHDAYQALYKVAEAFRSWKQNGKPGDENPAGRFGNGDYLRLAHSSVDIVENEDDFGVKLGLEPYNPEWFSIVAGSYQLEYLNRIVDNEDNLSAGSAEVHLSDDGTPVLHLTATEKVEVYDISDVDNLIGVDIGENVLAAVAVVDADGTVQSARIENGSAATGAEFRQKRDELSHKRDVAFQNGNLKKVTEARNWRERYTEHVLHTASKSIVNTALDNAAAGIVLENLTNYRETAKDPIHDWPYASFQKKIIYKANNEGIPVETIDPSGTSVTCRKCGCHDPMNRGQRETTAFDCIRCGYTVHADINAAINISLAEI